MNNSGSRLKILVLNRQFSLGGAERQIVNLLAGLDKNLFDVISVTFYEGGQFYDEVKRIPGVTCHTLKKRGRWDTIGFFYRYFRLLKEIQPDIIYGFLDAPNLLSLTGKLFGAKAVWGIRSAGIDLKSYDWAQNLLTHFENFFSRFADGIICNSHAGSKLAVSQGAPVNKVYVVPNGIDTTRFVKRSDSRNSLRAGWGIGDEFILIGLVGRIDAMKDHATFLRTAALALASNPKFRFICIGDGLAESLNRLKNLTSQLGIEDSIVWSDSIKNIENVYSALDIFCLTSIGEGFPNVIAEAMACETPCISTDAGDSSIIIGDPTRIAPVGDPVALSETLLKLAEKLNNEKIEIQTHARKRIVENFSVEKMIFNTEKVLREIARSP